MNKVKENYCPTCNEKLDAADSMELVWEPPSSGDLSICFYCATICMFDDDLTLVIPTQKEMDELPRETVIELANAIAFVQETIKKKSRWN